MCCPFLISPFNKRYSFIVIARLTSRKYLGYLRMTASIKIYTHKKLRTARRSVKKYLKWLYV